MASLSSAARAQLDAGVTQALDARRPAEAVSLLVNGYGPELLSFLGALHGDRDAATEVFSQTCEDLLRTLPRFRRECSYRTWLYALARNASRRHLEDPHAQRRVALSKAPELEQARRTTTAAFLRTDWKDRFRSLRESLSEDDRAILLLRVDRDMSWADIAEVVSGQTPAALRKRFERIKLALKARATEAGWLS